MFMTWVILNIFERGKLEFLRGHLEVTFNVYEMEDKLIYEL